MMELVRAEEGDLDEAMAMIDSAKKYLHECGIDQWQKGYPDRSCIREDIREEKGYFAEEGGKKLCYLCIDYGGEPAYDHLDGKWGTREPYVVVHRMAFSPDARGKGMSSEVFRLVEDMSRTRGVRAFRVDTDDANQRMKHVLAKNGFSYRGTIWFDNSVKIAYDKPI